MGHYAVRFSLWVDAAPPSRMTVVVEAENKDAAIEIARVKVSKIRPDAELAYDGCQYVTRALTKGSDSEALLS